MKYPIIYVKRAKGKSKNRKSVTLTKNPSVLGITSVSLFVLIWKLFLLAEYLVINVGDVISNG